MLHCGFAAPNSADFAHGTLFWRLADLSFSDVDVFNLIADYEIGILRLIKLGAQLLFVLIQRDLIRAKAEASQVWFLSECSFL